MRLKIANKIKMEIRGAKLLFAFAAIVFSLAACAGNENKNAARTANQAVNRKVEINTSDDTDELKKIIQLPAAPEEATFVKDDKKLIAVLKFSGADAAQIAAQAEKHKTPVALDVDAEDWFPPELVAQSQGSGDATLKGVEYAANDFTQPPYTSGKLIRVNDTNFFVLELSAP